MSLHLSSLLVKCFTCKGFIHEEVIHLTPDKTHDHEAVEQFVQKNLHHLEEKGVNIKEIIEFTDHAASQYKYNTIQYSNEMVVQASQEKELWDPYQTSTQKVTPWKIGMERNCKLLLLMKQFHPILVDFPICVLIYKILKKRWNPSSL